MAEAIKMGGGGGNITNAIVVDGFSETEDKIKANTFVELSREVGSTLTTGADILNNYSYITPVKCGNLKLNDYCTILLYSNYSSGKVCVVAHFFDNKFGEETDAEDITLAVDAYIGYDYSTENCCIKKISESLFIVVGYSSILVFNVDVDLKTVTLSHKTTLSPAVGVYGFTKIPICIYGVTNRHIFFGGVNNYTGASYPISFIYFKINEDNSTTILKQFSAAWFATGNDYLGFIPEKGVDAINNYVFFQSNYRYTDSPTFDNMSSFSLTSGTTYKFNLKLTENDVLLESVDSTELITASGLNYGVKNMNDGLQLSHTYDDKYYQTLWGQYSSYPRYYIILESSNGHIIPKYTLSVAYNDGLSSQGIRCSYDELSMIIETPTGSTSNGADDKYHISTFSKLLVDFINFSITKETDSLYIYEDITNIEVFIAPIIYVKGYLYQIPTYRSNRTSTLSTAIMRKKIDATQWEEVTSYVYGFPYPNSSSGLSSMVGAMYRYIVVFYSSDGLWLFVRGTGYRLGGAININSYKLNIYNIVFNLFKTSVSKIYGVTKAAISKVKSGKVFILKR